MRFRTLRLGICVWLGMALLAAPFSSAAIAAGALLAYPFQLAWNSSSDPEVMGYAVYYSLEGSKVTNRIDAGPNISVPLMNLQASSNYLFYVVSYDATGIESPPSNTLEYAPPALSPLEANVLPDGSVVLQFWAAVNASCRLEFSSTLSPPQWQLLSSTHADSNGQVTVTDPLPIGARARFYRAVEP